MGHHCKKLFHLEIVWADDSLENGVLETNMEDFEVEPNFRAPEISLHALAGSLPSHTMRLLGKIHKHSVVLLMDSGSSHNFLSISLTRKLNLPIKRKQDMRVMVAGGEYMECLGICHDLHVQLTGYEICADLFLIELNNVDVVMGIRWLQTLGPIT